MLLEAPVTIVLSNVAMRQSARLRKAFLRHRETLVCRALSKVFHLDPRWFRPYPAMSAEWLLKVYRVARDRKLPAVEMMLHSSELMPDGSPYNPTEASVERLYERGCSRKWRASPENPSANVGADISGEWCRLWF
jgi:hypothetical protein